MINKITKYACIKLPHFAFELLYVLYVLDTLSHAESLIITINHKHCLRLCIMLILGLQWKKILYADYNRFWERKGSVEL